MKRNNITVILNAIALVIVSVGFVIMNLLGIEPHRDQRHEDDLLRIYYIPDYPDNPPVDDQIDESYRFPTLMSLKKLTCNINPDFIGRKCPINRRPVQRNSTFAA